MPEFSMKFAENHRLNPIPVLLNYAYFAVSVIKNIDFPYHLQQISASFSAYRLPKRYFLHRHSLLFSLSFTASCGATRILPAYNSS